MFTHRVTPPTPCPPGRGQVHDMEELLPLFDRFLSPEATQYVVCIYKARPRPAPSSPAPSPGSSNYLRGQCLLLRRQGFNSLTNL